MGRHFNALDPDLTRPDPFPPLGAALDRDDLREAAYEVFFTACRSSPGFGGRNSVAYYSPNDDGRANGASGPGSPVMKPPGVGMAVTSRVKAALGLKMLQRSRSSSSRRASSIGSGTCPGSPGGSCSGSPRVGVGFGTLPAGRGTVMRRPMTAAEIMRQQMKVTEQSDNRLRKTLMKTLVGQMGRRAETIILPLELLRHLKQSDFMDSHEHHLWQKRQLKLLENGLLLHPHVPLEKDNFSSASKLRGIIDSSETKPIDTGIKSATMKTLSNCVVSLAWRGRTNTDDICHWADGYPLNVHIYTAFLSSIFDLKDETMVLDEVDELLELMKKTWPTLGINRAIHNLCFAWVLFEQYVTTGQVEPDLLGASLAMMNEVASDAKRVDREPAYLKMLGSVLNVVKKWADVRLMDYHSSFHRGRLGVMESVLPLVFSAVKILEEDVPCYVTAQDTRDVEYVNGNNRVDRYIRSSLSNAFAKMLENQNINLANSSEAQEASKVLIKLAKETEDLASKERDIFSPILKKWQPIACGVAAVTLHTCYGTVLKQYLTCDKSSNTNETVLVLQRAGKLEKALVQLVVEGSSECDDGGRTIVREMVPYEVDSIILRLLNQWIQEKLGKGKELLQRVKQTETWYPKSKAEPYADSAVEIVGFARECVESFFDIPVNVSDNTVFDLAEGLESIFRDYITFAASCGSKQSFLPKLPPLTRCSEDSKFLRLWKRAACSSVGTNDPNQTLLSNEGNNPRPSTSRGTQRLYIRLNTLHYLVAQLNSLSKSLSVSPKIIQTKARYGANKKLSSTSYFEHSQTAIALATQHVSEVAASRLVFSDSSSVLYGGLYARDVAKSRIRPALRILKQNITLLCAMVADRVQPLALKEVVKACFEAFLMVLLAGGSSRLFMKSDQPMIEEDFESLKRVFYICGEGLIVEDAVEREAERVEGVVALMGRSTEQLIEDLTNVASGLISAAGSGTKKITIPTTQSSKWNKNDADTILRVLCYRNDKSASQFLKKTFQLAKRRVGIKMV